MPTEAEYEQKLATARVEWRTLKNRLVAAEAELRKKTNLVQWVIACLGGDQTPGVPSEGEAAEAGQLKCWVDDVVVIATGKATDHVKRLQLLIDVARFHPPAMAGRLAPGAAAEDWAKLLGRVREHLAESGVPL